MTTSIRWRKSVAGQSVFVALAVLFLLAFLGALFITIISRNLNHVGRTTQTLNADYYAQAGINYANQMLETSLQGADWRPPLQALLAINVFNNTMNLQQQTAYLATVAPAGTTPATYTPIGGAGYTLPGVVAGSANANDPDAIWLQAGFSRFNVGNGRFLIRISYVNDPNTGFPNNGTLTPSGTEKYIRIESIGRFGNVDPTDPTTFVNQPPTRLRAEMVAYKPIGLVDYSRFITNKDNRPDTVNLGDPSVNTAAGLNSPYPATYTTPFFSAQATAQLQTIQTTLVTPNVVDFDPASLPNVRPWPIITTYGQPTGYAPYTSQSNIGYGGGNMRINANVRFHGMNLAYLNPAIGDSIEVAGNILLDKYNPNPAGLGNNANIDTVLDDQQAQFDVYSQAATGGAAAVTQLAPSNDPLNRYTTAGGFVRDGNAGSDQQGFPRAIQRLDPPSLDTTDPATGLTRYRGLTDIGTSAVNLGNPGTVYINNNSDIQTESQNIASGYSLRDEWLDRTGANGASAGNTNNWQADFYVPPGVVIRFGPIPNPNPPTTGNPQPYLMLSNGEQAWGITMTRSDKDASGNPVFWPMANGNPGTSQTIYLVYAPLNAPAGENPPPPTVVNPPAGYPYFFMNAENAPGATAPVTQPLVDPDNDITIFAEGNVRVSGMVSDPQNQNGNNYFQHVTIVTNGIGYIDGSLMKGGPGYGQLVNNSPSFVSQSSVAVLAESYICVNTTQFMAGPTNFDQATSPTTPSSASPFVLDFGPGQSLTEPVYLSQVNDFSGLTTASPLSLYISQFTPSGLDATLEQGQAVFQDLLGNIFTSTGNGLLPAFHNNAYGGSNGAPSWSSQTTLPIINNNPGFGMAVNNILPFQLTFSLPSANTTQGWDMEHAGIFPANARIEAILYAQNNSFFVIPGPWFNTNTNDTIFNVNAPGGPRAAGTDSDPGFSRFPMNGQPVDLQISIYGTVAENLPADIGDQAAWDQKWAWIPIYHGNLYPGGPANGGTAETSPLRDPEYAGETPQVGLNFSYDPMDGFDFIPNNGAGGGPVYVRLDPFGRPLPVAPDLPVSTDLLYSGQSQNTSLLP